MSSALALAGADQLRSIFCRICACTRPVPPNRPPPCARFRIDFGLPLLGLHFAPQALVFLALATNVFLALALGLDALAFLLFFFALLALGFFAFLALALRFFFLLAQLFETLLLDQRILSALFLFGLASQFLAVVGLGLWLLGNRVSGSGSSTIGSGSGSGSGSTTGGGDFVSGTSVTSVACTASGVNGVGRAYS